MSQINTKLVRFFRVLANLTGLTKSLTDAGFTAPANSLTAVSEELKDHYINEGLEAIGPMAVKNSGLVRDNTTEPPELTAPLEAGTMAGRRYFNRLKRRKVVKKKWLCCKKPKLRRVRQKNKGSARFWVSICRYKTLQGRKIGSATIVVSRDPASKPKFVTIKGKQLSWCRGA